MCTPEGVRGPHHYSQHREGLDRACLLQPAGLLGRNVGGQLARQGGEGLVTEGPSGSAGPSLSPPPSPCPDPLLGFALVP